VRVIALLATYNEERFVASCLEHLIQSGVEVFLIDNESSDGTVEIARSYLGNGLVGLEIFPRGGVYRWRPLLRRKSELAVTLDADWFLHVDADDVRLPPSTGTTLAEALLDVDSQGYNAVNFQEFTFVPTQESPDHDHPEFERTMRWYYPLLPGELHQLKAWKRSDSIELAATGGHAAHFAGRRVYPKPFPMRHYLFLSVPHAVRKFVERRYDADEVAAGLHVARAALRAEEISLQSESELREYVSDGDLDASSPRTNHPLFSAPAVSSG
jgi:glycosyltransferase involved in cell wall biosynthesis